MSRRGIVSFSILSLAVSACDPTTRSTAGDHEVDGAEIESHMRALSSDALMGRGPGHPGGDAAAGLIADHFSSIGLTAPDGSYLQSVPMVGAETDPGSASLTFTGPSDEVLSTTYLDDFVANPGDPEAETAGGRAELVFVGYGIDAPENGWDDFAGVDVAGKYLLILVNDPPAPSSEPDLFGGVAMTYYGRWTYKYEEAARQGALGALIVHDTEPAGYPWNVVRGGWSGERFALPPDPRASPAGVEGWVTRDVARRVLGMAGLDLDELEDRAATRGFVAVPTGVHAEAAVRSTVRPVETANVVGLLEGSTRADEYITVTAHYDHFGIGEAIDGDSIYNGAYDNASGTALIMALASSMAEMEEGPERSVLFIATGAEEQGLLGAQWYVQSPLFPLAQTVAELNVDGANLWGETRDVIVQGEERSGLGDFVRPRASELSLTLRPDAEPEKGFFFRSDHFPFAKAGVPSLYFEHGRDYVGRPEGWGAEIQADYTAARYHAPSDEFSEEFVFDGAVQQAELVRLTLLDIAGSDAWPNWHEGQEFKAARDAMMAGR